ncbi:ISAs1 family transposase [uncultured Nostoc sp.]|uniref:ISAs1 family transposase n=1 Tax=uncultured Nostoc sp. TaxID=340711 RepID=UPI0035CBFCF9
MRRALLHVDYEDYSVCLSKFFNVQPNSGETVGKKSKVLKGSYQIENDNPKSDSHRAIMLVSSYIVERGLILEPFQVDAKTNDLIALPELISKLALKEVILLLMLLILKKTCELIINSGNDYIAGLKGNQPNLFKDVKANFTPEFTCKQINKGHGRIEKRHVSICQNLDGIRSWPGLTTLIQVKSDL